MHVITFAKAQRTMQMWQIGELYLIQRPNPSIIRSRPVNKHRTTASKLLRDAQAKGVSISALERADGTLCYRKA